MRTKSISLVIPVHNESQSIVKNLDALCNFLSHDPLVKRFEILVVDNGSTDITVSNARTYSKKSNHVRVMSIRKRSLGKAIQTGLKKGKYEVLMFYAIDLPFGTNIIHDSIREILNGADVVFGSKYHEKSIYSTTHLRNLVSITLNNIIGLLFKLGIKDTRGSFAIKRELYNKIQRKLNSNSAWIQVQVAIQARQENARLMEIPVSSNFPQRNSRMKISDLFGLVRDLLREYLIR